MAISRGARRLSRTVALAVAAGLFVSSCSGESAETPGAGVTSEPCPKAVHADTGCIYLGILSDLGSGPYAIQGLGMYDGQLAFWREVNKAGGIGGYEIDITTYARDTGFEATRHSAEYDSIAPHVLAMAMSLGTAQTLAVLAKMDADDMITGAGTLWSGWQYRDVDLNLVFDGGYSYCTEAILGLDWFAQAHYQPDSIAIVGFRGNYGADYANGVVKWAERNGAHVSTQIFTGPNVAVGSQRGAIAEILSNGADLVALATGPAETAEIVGSLAAAGYTGRVIGSAPTWHGALLRTPAAPALTALYNFTSPVDGLDGTSTGVQRARAAAAQTPTNWGYNLGWASSYPMKAVLTEAADRGTLNRSGMRAVLDDLSVDSEGMAATITYGNDGPVLADQHAMINAPDAERPLGSRTVATDFHGSTLDRLSLASPCSTL